VSVNGAASTGASLTYDWNWGDGTTHGSGVTATHAYTSIAGSPYTITLTVSDPVGAGTPATRQITVNLGPTAAFTPNVTAISTNGAVLFTDQSTNSPQVWNWSFGDGSPWLNGTASSNPVHTYTANGTYVVTLLVNNTIGSSSATATINVYDPPTGVSITANPTTLLSGNTVVFNGTYSGFVNSWDWNFGDGTPHATTRNTTHVYTATSNTVYLATYTVSNPAASSSNTKDITVTIPTLPVPVITSGGVTTGDVPLVVTFSSSSSDVISPTAYYWVFGDGTTSTVANPPAHTFTTPGSYLVNLSITNASGTGTSALYPIVATTSVAPPNVTNSTISGSNFSVNLTGNVGNYTSDATNIYLYNVTGFSEIIVTTNGVNTSGGNLSGTITSVEYILPNTTALVNGATINFQPTIFEYGWSTSPFLMALTIPDAGENSTYQSQLSGSTGYNPLAVINISTGDLTSGGTLNMSVPIWWYTNYGGSYSTASTNYLAVIWNHGGTISTIYPTWGPTSADGLSKWFTISVPGFSTGGIVGATSAAASGGGGGYSHQNTNNYGGVGVGGGVGYVGPAPAAALATSLNTATFTQDSQGQVTQDYQINTGNEGSLFVPSGTKVLAKDGSVLNSVSVTTMQSSGVPAGAGYTFAGYAVSCSPDGATFTPAITLKFTLTTSEWNTLLAQAQGNTGYLGIKVYNPTTSSWTRVPTMVDANAMTVSALVSHFSTYGLFVDTTLASPSVTTVQTNAPTAPVTTSGSGAAIPWTIVIGVIVIIIVVAGAGYYFFGRKKQGL
jgi:PKD repeat protein